MLLLKVHDFPAALTPTESWMLHSSMLGFALASILALLGLFWPKRFGLAPTNVITTISALALTVYFGSRFSSVGAAPLGSVFETMLLVSLGVVAGYFALMLKRPQATLAGWVLPMVTVIQVAALPLGGMLTPAVSSQAQHTVMNDPILIAHVVLAMMATVHFIFAFLVALMFLLQDRTLKLKHDTSILRALPSLETLERMVFVAVAVGFGLLTVALVLGFASVWDTIGSWLRNPTVVASLAIWLVFLFVLIRRYNHAFRGRREMYMVLIGFLFVVVVYVLASLFPKGA